MGIVPSLCKESGPTKNDLAQTVQQQSANIHVLNSQLNARHEDIDALKIKLANVEGTVKKITQLVSPYYREMTAYDIMESKLHLTYMDDTVEHEYICKLLSWIDNKVFERGISFEPATVHPPLAKTKTQAELDNIAALLNDSD